ncbi:MAG: extracellular solute-binding protein [Candidatus Promineifilaceae bacterium]|nr:extracellular solute-binding protein [Candidatus Promineifilaceae bacterium]
MSPDRDVRYERVRPAARFAVVLLVTAVGVLTLLAACGPDLSNPPRLATATAQESGAPTATPEPLNLPAPTATGEAGVIGEAAAATSEAMEPNPTLTLWVNKTTPQYEAALEEMIAAFSSDHAINVELVTMAPDQFPDLVQTAAVSPTYPLPDVMVLPLEYSIGWAEEGILDAPAAQAIVEELGPETFDQDALGLVTVDGQAVAVPSDGWQQVFLYRSDWFEERGLAPPVDYSTILTAAAVISDQANLIYSYNMPTESSLRATTRRFEQMAIANGCQLIDDKGELLILEAECQEALEFYRFLCNTYCPPGVQTEVSTLNAYLEGRAGMIMASPGALVAIAGLDEEYRPSCEACTTAGYLAENTGVVTTISGRGPEASPENFGQMAYLGITRAADREAAEAFARFWFNEGYLEWLAVEPERKVPMRRGTAAEPTRFIDSWYGLPLAADGRTLSDIYGEETADLLARDVVNVDRWGYTQGAGTLITTIYENLTFSILLQELLSGYYDSSRAAIEGYKRLVELIPDYEYYVDPEATPES